jgi:hypothetical protein
MSGPRGDLTGRAFLMEMFEFDGAVMVLKSISMI